MHEIVVFVLKCQQQILAIQMFQLQVAYQTLLVAGHPFLFHGLFLRCQGIAVVLFKEVFWIFKINLKNPSILCDLFFLRDLLLCWHNTFSFEISFREWFAHCPSAKVVRVKIHDVLFGLLRSKSGSIGLFAWRISRLPSRFRPAFLFPRRDAFQGLSRAPARLPSFPRARPSSCLATCNNRWI